MARIFISHSSTDDGAALALRDWLSREGWSQSTDVFLDIHADSGIAAGQRWIEALEDAATRCEAVVFLISERWLGSKWCRDEYEMARQLNKKLFAALIDDTPLDALPSGLTAEWQVVRLDSAPSERFRVTHPLTNTPDVAQFSVDGLTRLKRGLMSAGIGPESFQLQQDAASPFGWRAPYRGLQAFEAEDAAVFFGREAEILRGIDVLRGMAMAPRPRFLVVLGASGAGKSSFLRAGLLPRLLRDDALWAPLRPVRHGGQGAIEGRDEGLLAALEEVWRRFGAPRDRAALRPALAEPSAFVAELQALRAAAARRALVGPTSNAPLCLLSIDQAEELFAADAGDQPEQLLTLARAGLESGDLAVVATIRSDAYGPLQSARSLAGLHQQTFSLGPVSTGELGRVIRAPAEALRAKIGPSAPRFSPETIRALQDEMSGEADALPLLAFALERLMTEHAGASEIGLAELEATGGVAHAIEAAAEAALSAAGVDPSPAARREAVRAAFAPRLARIDPESKLAQRRPASADATTDARTRRLLEAFQARRLIVSKGDGDSATFEVAHEALLRRWPTLAEILSEDRDALLLLDGVAQAAAEWRAAKNERRRDLLIHRGARLADAQALAARGGDWAASLAPNRDYLDACRTADDAAAAAEARKARNLRTALAASLVLLVGAAIAGGFAYQQRSVALRERAAAVASEQIAQEQRAAAEAQRESADAQRRIAEEQQAIATTQRDAALTTQSLFMSDLSRRLVSDGNSNAASALLLALEGLPDDTQPATARPWVQEAEAALNNGVARLSEVRVTPLLDGTQDRDARNLWPDVAFSPDGSLIVANAGDARVWDVRTGEETHRYEGETLTFSPDGARLLLTDRDGGSRMLDAATGEELFALPLADTDLWGFTRAKFTPDGAYVVAGFGHWALVWDAKTGALIREIEHKVQGGANEFALSNEEMLVSGYAAMRLVYLFQSGIDAVPQETEPGTEFDLDLENWRAISATGRANASIWDALTGDVEMTFLGHTGAVTSARFIPEAGPSPNGGELTLTTSQDGTARIWETLNGREVVRLEGHSGPVSSAAISPDGALVATASADGSVRLWDLAKAMAPTRTVIAAEALAQAEADGAAPLFADPKHRRDGARFIDQETSADVARFESGDLNLDGMIFDFHPTSKRIAGLVVETFTTHIWDGESGEEVARFEHPDGLSFDAVEWGSFLGVAFSPDGALVGVTYGARSALIWDIDTQDIRLRLDDPEVSMTRILFTPDGERVVTLGASANDGDFIGRLRVWDLATTLAVASYQSNGDPHQSLTLAPDGVRISTFSNQGNHVWELPARGQDLIESGKRAAPRCLTQAERAAAFLPSAPPRWCITGVGVERDADPATWRPLWPYHSAAWRDWLVARDRGEEAPPPE